LEIDSLTMAGSLEYRSKCAHCIETISVGSGSLRQMKGKLQNLQPMRF